MSAARGQAGSECAIETVLAAAGRVLLIAPRWRRKLGLRSRAYRLSLPLGARRAGSTLAQYTSDVPRRWRWAKPYVLPTAGAAPSASFSVRHCAAPSERHTAAAGRGFGSLAWQRSNARSAPPTASSGTRQRRDGRPLRVSGRLVRLAGIDAPNPAQTLRRRPNGRAGRAPRPPPALWREWCGPQGFVRTERRRFRRWPRTLPTAVPVTSTSLPNSCARDTFLPVTDPAAEYAGEEETAKAEKLGIWQGQNDQPDAWRTKIWDEAKRAAPDGCPIKGSVRSEGRVYSMPWSTATPAARLGRLRASGGSAVRTRHVPRASVFSSRS